MYYHPKPAASHAAALRLGQLRHVIRVASITGRQPILDLLHPSGQMREEVYLRAAITKHSRPRTIFTPPKTIAAVEAWLAHRRERGWGLSSDPAADEQAIPAGGYQG